MGSVNLLGGSGVLGLRVLAMVGVLLLPMLALTSKVGEAQGCSVLYANNGWAVDLCPTDPAVTSPMKVTVDGVSKGSAALMRVYNATDDGTSVPQVAVIYASGYVRLKQNAEPAGAPIPFGSSFVLGPAAWPNATTYWHNPQLTTLQVKTSALPSLLKLVASGKNGSFKVSYQMSLPAPTDLKTRLRVVQTVTAKANVAIDPGRAANGEGFKTAAQISSMFANQNGPCDGGHVDCHDADAARFLGMSGVRRELAFNDVVPSTLMFPSREPMGGRWLDVLHSDDRSWQGNTPSVRLCLDVLPTDRTLTPQGFLAATTNPNDDNVGLWIQDDLRAATGWLAGQTEKVSYSLVAQDAFPPPTSGSC